MSEYQFLILVALFLFVFYKLTENGPWKFYYWFVSMTVALTASFTHLASPEGQQIVVHMVNLMP